MNRSSAASARRGPPVTPPPSATLANDAQQSQALQERISRSPIIPAICKANLIKVVKLFYCSELAELVFKFVKQMQVNTDFTSAYATFIEAARPGCLRDRYKARLQELAQLPQWRNTVPLLVEMDSLMTQPVVLAILYPDNDGFTSVDELVKRFRDSSFRLGATFGRAVMDYDRRQAQRVEQATSRHGVPARRTGPWRPSLIQGL